jgi:hypothetical protein
MGWEQDRVVKGSEKGNEGEAWARKDCFYRGEVSEKD